jgi:hypothetical protein
MGYQVNTIAPERWEGNESFFGGIGTDPILSKAISEAGAGVDMATLATTGRALGRESLDDVLQVVTISEKRASLWRALKKDPLFATIDQYDRLTSEGDDYFGVGTSETGSPPDAISNIARAFVGVRHYRDIRKTSDIIGRVSNIVDPVKQAEKDGTRRLVKILNTDLYWGNSAIPTRVDGLYETFMFAGNNVPIQDYGGKVMVEGDEWEWVTADVMNAGGTSTHAFLNPLLGADFNLMYEANKRLTVSAGENAGGATYYGAALGGLDTANGRLEFERDPFNKIGWACPTVSRGPEAPAAPTLNSATPAGTSSNSLAGTYYYKVTAVSDNGESAPATSGAIVVAEGEHVAINVTPNGNGTTGFRVYRSARDAGSAADCRFLWQFKWDGAGATEWNDTFVMVPGTAHIPILDMLPEDTTMQWSQLVALEKKDFAPIGFYEWFGLTLSGAFRISKPEWCAAMMNILPLRVRQAGWDPMKLYAS